MGNELIPTQAKPDTHRETDVPEHHWDLPPIEPWARTRWEWGPAGMWLWIAAIFFGFLAFTAIVYFMPQALDAAQTTIRVY